MFDYSNADEQTKRETNKLILLSSLGCGKHKIVSNAEYGLMTDYLSLSKPTRVTVMRLIGNDPKCLLRVWFRSQLVISDITSVQGLLPSPIKLAFYI